MPDNWWPSCTQCGASLFCPGNRLLRPVTWRSFLRFHPDKDFVDVVMAGLEFGWELHGQRHTPTDCANSRLHANMRANFARSERKNSHYISEQAPSLH